MGTPEFAVESLRALVENNYNVVAVVTMPDKPVGRHHDTLQASPVKQYAVEQGIPVLQPERLKDEAFLDQLRSYKADIQVVVAFRMLPEVVWAMPPRGTFNLHAALLPQYRGAAPINWAIINGETRTGVTTFFLDHDIDTGRIIHRESCEISDVDTVETVYERLMRMGAKLVMRTLDDVESDCVQPIPQDELVEGELHSAPKIFKDTCRIDWSSHTVKSAYDFIRGLSPYPGAWTVLRDAKGKEQVLKVFNSLIPDSQRLRVTPTSKVNTPLAIPVTLSDGILYLTDIQLAGKKRMSAADFLRGFNMENVELV